MHKKFLLGSKTCKVKTKWDIKTSHDVEHQLTNKHQE